MSQIRSVEKQNEMAINVVGYENKAIVAYQLTNEEPKSHYVWIKDLNRLLYDQTKHKERKHFCKKCLHGYSREDLLQRHRPESMGMGDRAVRIEIPIRGRNNTLKFTLTLKR